MQFWIAHALFLFCCRDSRGFRQRVQQDFTQVTQRKTTKHSEHTAISCHNEIKLPYCDPSTSTPKTSMKIAIRCPHTSPKQSARICEFY